MIVRIYLLLILLKSNFKVYQQTNKHKFRKCKYKLINKDNNTHTFKEWNICINYNMTVKNGASNN